MEIKIDKLKTNPRHLIRVTLKIDDMVYYLTVTKDELIKIRDGLKIYLAKNK